jgi:hypothetical protein
MTVAHIQIGLVEAEAVQEEQEPLLQAIHQEQEEQAEHILFLAHP